MYKYTSSRFKTRAEQEVKKAEHVARIGNPPPVQEGLGGGHLGDTAYGQSRIQEKALSNTRGQAVLLNHWSNSFCASPLNVPVSSGVFLPRLYVLFFSHL